MSSHINIMQPKPRRLSSLFEPNSPPHASSSRAPNIQHAEDMKQQLDRQLDTMSSAADRMIEIQKSTEEGLVQDRQEMIQLEEELDQGNSSIESALKKMKRIINDGDLPLCKKLGILAALLFINVLLFSLIVSGI